MHPIPSDSIIDFKSHFILCRARNCVCDAVAPSKLRRASPEQLAHPSYPSLPTRSNAARVNTLAMHRGVLALSNHELMSSS